MEMLGPAWRRAVIFGWVLFFLGVACTPPTPPASPTPWPVAPATPVGRITPPPRLSPTSAATPTVTPRPNPTLRPGLISLTVWENLPPQQRAALAGDIKAFQREFPAYSVASQAYESPETFMPALLNGEIKVDVVLASPVLLNSLWAAGQIAPMSDFFPPSFIDAFAATPLSGANQAGALWGLPDSAGFHLLLFYNREVINLPPATIDELSELAQELGPGGLALNSYDPLWVLPWLVPPQGWLRQESGRWAVDLPAMEQALTYHQKWHQLAMTGEPAGPYSQARQRFLQGQAALLIDGEWSLSEWSDGAGPIWAVAPLPQLGQRQSGQPAAPLVLARYWAVNRATAGDQALVAAIFLEYITRPQRQLAWTSRFGLLPTRREALNDPAIVADPILRVSASQMLAGQSLPLELNPNLLFDAMRQPLRQMLDGALTPAEAAQQIQLNLAAE